MEEAGPRRKRRKGGVQQRLAQATDEQSSSSALHDLLMNYFAQGLLSAAFIHSIVSA